MTTPCPHCWPPEAQQLAADQATIAALQVENARLARELAEHDAWYKAELDSLRERWNQSLVVAAGYNAELIQEYHGNAILGDILGAHDDETMQECAMRVMRENARLMRELAERDASQAMPATYKANWNAELAGAVIRTKLGAREDETLWDCVERVAHENAALRARIISQHALIDSQARIRRVLIAALRRQAARLRALGA